jgi:aspartyl-tRNA(Asn)/glutamyl-tRNA(Gln) amidotransferase subunit A
MPTVAFSESFRRELQRYRMQFTAFRCVVCLLALQSTSQFALPHAPPFSARNTRLFSLLQQNELIRSGRATSESIVRRSLEITQQRDAHVRAMLAVYGDRALARARQIDESSCASQSFVCGVPIAVKANLCDAQARCNAGSTLLDTFRPSFTHPALKKLQRAGAIIVGSTNMDEFGMGSFTVHSKYQATQHPHLPGYSAGGSSGGAAAAVAAGYVAAAIGTDTGGSVRQPAAWCGVVGLKPTYGRISRSGMWAYASSTDSVGVITTSVAVSGRVVRLWC